MQKHKRPLMAAIGALALVGLAQAQYTYTTLDFPGSLETWSAGNSNTGVAGGFVDDGGNVHGWYMRNGGPMIQVDNPSPGTFLTALNFINNSGTITGRIFRTESGVSSSRTASTPRSIWPAPAAPRRA